MYLYAQKEALRFFISCGKIIRHHVIEIEVDLICTVDCHKQPYPELPGFPRIKSKPIKSIDSVDDGDILVFY